MFIYTFYFGMWVLANLPAANMNDAVQIVNARYPGWMEQCLKVERTPTVYDATVLQRSQSAPVVVTPQVPGYPLVIPSF